MTTRLIRSFRPVSCWFCRSFMPSRRTRHKEIARLVKQLGLSISRVTPATKSA